MNKSTEYNALFYYKLLWIFYLTIFLFYLSEQKKKYNDINTDNYEIIKLRILKRT